MEWAPRCWRVIPVPSPPPGSKPGAPAAKPKRRFPYRKVAEIEQDVFQCEARIQELHVLLAQPEVLRSGDRVRQLRAELAACQESLARLYDHWEEASHLNWS